jgi:FAD/FMN-containing dehydrogenase
VTARSWGNYPKVEHAAIVPMPWRHLDLPRVEGSILPSGLSRSYGDSCLNEGNTLVATPAMDRFIEFDRETGVMRCEAGVSLASILELVVPAGWFLPVVPGTAFVTVGGAIANDVHGKNHHAAGTFGHHVLRFELLRSDGTRTECSPQANAELFRATIGGLGLTGLVTWAEVQLVRVASQFFDVETLRVDNLEHFFKVSDESAASHAYTVGWIDAFAEGAEAGRGVFMRANHSSEPGGTADPPRAGLAMPVDLPGFVLNPVSIGAFNTLYRSRASGRWTRSRDPYSKYLFPLDGIGHWNRMYGKDGFFQHQSVVPRADAAPKLREMLSAIAKAKQASFLSVLKVFGDREAAGLMSFPRPGVTLALDFPARGSGTLELLERLDAIVRDAGGAIYPAKDARMSPATFRASFPGREEFARHIDPAFSSSFWRRVNA